MMSKKPIVVYWGYIGIIEKKWETTVVPEVRGFRYIASCRTWSINHRIALQMVGAGKPRLPKEAQNWTPLIMP